MLKTDLKELENNVKLQWEKDSAYLLWNLQNLSKDLRRLTGKKLINWRHKSDAGFDNAIVFVVKLEKHVADKIWQLIP